MSLMAHGLKAKEFLVSYHFAKWGTVGIKDEAVTKYLNSEIVKEVELELSSLEAQDEGVSRRMKILKNFTMTQVRRQINNF